MRTAKNSIKTAKNGKPASMALRPRTPMPLNPYCIYTAAEAAAVLRIHEDTLRAMVRRGDIEASTTKAGVRVKGSAIDNYMEKTRIFNAQGQLRREDEA